MHFNQSLFGIQRLFLCTGVVMRVYNFRSGSSLRVWLSVWYRLFGLAHSGTPECLDGSHFKQKKAIKKQLFFNYLFFKFVCFCPFAKKGLEQMKFQEMKKLQLCLIQHKKACPALNSALMSTTSYARVLLSEEKTNTGAARSQPLNGYIAYDF